MAIRLGDSDVRSEHSNLTGSKTEYDDDCLTNKYLMTRSTYDCLTTALQLSPVFRLPDDCFLTA
jgi:hypothetical protein